WVSAREPRDLSRGSCSSVAGNRRLLVHRSPGTAGSYAAASMEPSALLAMALELADVADSLTMARFRASDLVVQTKPDLTPVSEADRAVEQAIRDRLAVDAPDHAVFGEEFGEGSCDSGGDQSRAAEVRGDGSATRWIVDPIDGTKSYVRGIPV